MALELPVRVRVDGAPEANTAFAGMGSSVVKMAGAFALAQIGVESARAVFEKIKTTVIDSVKAYDDEIVSVTKLRVQFGAQTDSLTRLAKSQSESTRFSKDAIQASESYLGLHKLNAAEIKKLLPVIEDHAAMLGGVEEATRAFSYAIEYGTGRALRPFGIEIGKDGSQLDIYNNLLKLGTDNTKGLAGELGKIGVGPWIKLGHEVNEIKEDFGKLIMDSALWTAALWSAEAAVKAIKFIIDPLNSKAKEETRANEETVEVLHRKTKVLQEEIQLANAIKKSHGEDVTFVDAAGRTVTQSLKDAEETLKRIKKTTETTPQGTQLGKTQEQKDLDAAKAKEKAKKVAEEMLAAQKYYNESLANMAEDETSKALSEENIKYSELKKTAKANTTELANIEKGHQNNVAAIMKKAYDKDITAQLETDNKEIKQAKKTADELKRIADKRFQEHVALTAEYIRQSEEMAQAAVGMGEQLGSSIGAGIGKGRAGYKIALKGILDDAISFIEKQAIAAAVSATATLPVTPVSLIWGGIAGAGITAAAEVAKAEIAKFAGGTVSVPGTGGGDSVPAWVKPGEMIANQAQKDNILAAIMNGAGGSTTNNNNASHTYHIDNRVIIQGNVDPRAARDFSMSREASDRRLMQQLRRINMSGQNQGIYSR